MSRYNDEQLSALIVCQKHIVDPPAKQMKLERGSLRNGMTLESLDGQHRFHVFFRRSEDFVENFSIGLDYLPKDEAVSFCLIRCNGKHNGHKVHQHHLSFLVCGAMPRRVWRQLLVSNSRKPTCLSRV